MLGTIFDKLYGSVLEYNNYSMGKIGRDHSSRTSEFPGR
jgi:hypothetical protein